MVNMCGIDLIGNSDHDYVHGFWNNVYGTLLNLYVSEKDIGRSTAYRKAIGWIKGLRQQLTLDNLNTLLPQVGPKIREKIQEILKTGLLNKSEAVRNEYQNMIIQTFSQIWGVGSSVAHKLFTMGYRSISDIRNNPDILNRNQKVAILIIEIGLKYYEDLIVKMPREEVATIIDYIQTTIKAELKDEWLDYDLVCCGSYRRGRSHCGDIDLLISRKDNQPHGDFLSRFVAILQKAGLLKETLQLMRDVSSKGTQTYMGICKLADSKLFRRIDIKVITVFDVDLSEEVSRLCDDVFYRI